MIELCNVDATLLAARAREWLPNCVLAEAVGSGARLKGDRLARYFGSLTRIPDFGTRLVLLAGLALDALYVDAALEATPGFDRDDPFEIYLRDLLFADRGADLGLACAAVQRMGVLQGGPVADLVGDDRCVTSFVMSRPTSTGNFLRGQLTCPVEDQLLHLLQHVRFLGRFAFGGPGEVTFDERPIELGPFLWWDGRHLWRLRRFHRGEPPNALWRRTEDDEEVEFRLELRELEFERVRRIAALVKVSPSVVGGALTLESERLPQSFVPMFADSQPKMTRLAQQIFLKAETATKVELWTRDRSQEWSSFTAEELAEDANFVTNAVLRQCMEKNPISVLEAYFAMEQGDQKEYLSWLTGSDEEAERMFADIRQAAARYERKLTAFYCGTKKDDFAIKKWKYQARLAAMKVVELLGFPVIPETELEDPDDLGRRIVAFRDYLRDPGHKRDTASVNARNGLLECCNGLEAILRTLVLFYEAVKHFDIDRPDGLGDAALERVATAKKRLPKGLGQLIGLFRDLGEDRVLRRKLADVAGRDTLWPPGEEAKRHFTAMNDLNAWRIKDVHASSEGGSAGAVFDLSESLLGVLDWLTHPREPSVAPEWRLFPAHLSLNLVTTNSCGISSIRYSLTRPDRHHEITLYTKQPLSVLAGSLLDLPHLGKARDDLWVNPVLIPASAVGS
jgi:hypothetical protein